MPRNMDPEVIAKGVCQKCGKATWRSHAQYYFGIVRWCKGCGWKERRRNT